MLPTGRRRSAPARALVLLLVLPGAALAQVADTARARTQRSHVVTIQPLGIPALWFSGEYEGAAHSNLSLGAGGSYFSIADITYTSFDAKVRFYPAQALRGFAVGITGGYSRITHDETEDDVSAPTVGTQLDYQWLLGERRRFALALGLGLKRVIVKDEDLPDFSVVYPTARMSVGYAF